ncbi:proline dehydrogenase family protein [Sulfobacillus harzensis]|uniref:proline dehydrogenase n=1 Tax=Sulfobacillus harzensis TaxID=2729629 RepID=A0A7Y0L2A8_9FIRM|nr:proline dehydrogenase family protein [Sulfobacillus harzensis]NMP21989.1 proline dehydrogenase [Sulfobacillus harzensis]
MFREVVLGLGGNPVVEGMVKRYGMQLGAARFVAGSTLPEAIERIREINGRGVMVTLDHLGESVRSEAEAMDAKNSYLAMLDGIHQSGVNANVSLKLTMMGLALNEDLAQRNLDEIVTRAEETGNFVRIDMEDSPYTDVTLRLYDEAYQAHPGHVGVVLQAYLYRTMDDLRRLSNPPRNFRIVKGAYMEPVSVAFPSKADVDENYLQLVQESLKLGNYTAIGTHDEQLIGRILKFLHEENIERDRFEFQMLYGVKFSLLESLAREGYRTRVYVPYGEDWYAYYVRRIAERPANLLFFARALVDR